MPVARGFPVVCAMQPLAVALYVALLVLQVEMQVAHHGVWLVSVAPGKLVSPIVEELRVAHDLNEHSSLGKTGVPVCLSSH